MVEGYVDNRTTLEAMRRVHHASGIASYAAWLCARRVERDGVIYFITREDAVACDLPGVAQAITKEDFNEAYTIDVISAIACVLAHSAIPADLWGTSAGDDAAESAIEAERPNQMGLLRDIFGNPFRLSPPLPQAVLGWNNSTVRRIAQGIYEERQMPQGILDTGRLAILHDALLDAGCDNEELLTHLRSEGRHVRGCWAIDLVRSVD